jgi:hypothetical protein
LDCNVSGIIEIVSKSIQASDQTLSCAKAFVGSSNVLCESIVDLGQRLPERLCSGSCAGSYPACVSPASAQPSSSRFPELLNCPSRLVYPGALSAPALQKVGRVCFPSDLGIFLGGVAMFIDFNPRCRQIIKEVKTTLKIGGPLLEAG